MWLVGPLLKNEPVVMFRCTYVRTYIRTSKIEVTRAMGGYYPPPPVPSVRPGHPSARRGVGQFNDR